MVLIALVDDGVLNERFTWDAVEIFVIGFL